MSDCLLYNNCNHKDCNADFCPRRIMTDSLCNAALISNGQRAKFALKIDADGTDLEQFKRLANIEAHIAAFVKQGKNLYLHSPNCGNGKTSWCLRFILAYIDYIWPQAEQGECRVMFINVPKLLVSFKDEIRYGHNDYVTSVLAGLDHADLVVWDDIAAKTGSQYDIDQIHSRLEERLNAHKSNIFTSNLGPSEIANALGERLASRICNMSIDIELHGADKRSLINGGNN